MLKKELEDIKKEILNLKELLWRRYFKERSFRV